MDDQFGIFLSLPNMSWLLHLPDGQKGVNFHLQGGEIIVFGLVCSPQWFHQQDPVGYVLLRQEYILFFIANSNTWSISVKRKRS